MYPEIDKIKELVDESKSVLIIQADNPDADSLGSALAVEQVLGDQNKETYLFCAVDMPTYLRYMPGWDRVNKELPKDFDLSIIVDASTMTLLEKLSNDSNKARLSQRPCVVLDHHSIVENLIPFETVKINDPNHSSTGELIYAIAKPLNWKLSIDGLGFIMNSILGDTQGLTNQLATAETYKIMAELVEAGVNRPELEEVRREYAKMPPEIYSYKAELINRTQFAENGKLAYVLIPQEDINKYSPLYNPAPLIQGDMLQTKGVLVAIVFKSYDNGVVTGAIRCNPSAAIAAELAKKLGGGGHKFAAGFKTPENRDFNKIKEDCLNFAHELLNDLDNNHEDI